MTSARTQFCTSQSRVQKTCNTRALQVACLHTGRSQGALSAPAPRPSQDHICRQARTLRNAKCKFSQHMRQKQPVHQARLQQHAAQRFLVTAEAATGGRGSHVHSDLRVQERLGRLGDLAAHAYRESQHSGHEGQVVPHFDAFSCTAGAEAPHQHVYRVQDAVLTFNAERLPLLYLNRCLPGICSRQIKQIWSKRKHCR